MLNMYFKMFTNYLEKYSNIYLKKYLHNKKSDHHVFENCLACVKKMIHVHTKNVQPVLEIVDIYQKGTKQTEENTKKIEGNR